MKFAVLFVLFIAGAVVASEETIDTNSRINEFIKRMEKNTFTEDEAKKRFESLLKETKLILEKNLNVALDLIDGKSQIGNYFETIILNAALDDKSNFFTNPLDEKFKDYKKINPLKNSISLSDVKDENYKYIFQKYFLTFILETASLDDENFNLLLPITANMTFFAFHNKTVLSDFIYRIKNTENIDEKKKL